jgi:hypothetical protein
MVAARSGSVGGRGVWAPPALALAMLGAAVGLHWRHPVRRDHAAPQQSLASVDVNCADVGAFCLLPGVGRRLAGRIVTHRELFGPFVTIDALESVPGIGPLTLTQIRPLLRADAQVAAAGR